MGAKCGFPLADALRHVHQTGTVISLESLYDHQQLGIIGRIWRKLYVNMADTLCSDTRYDSGKLGSTYLTWRHRYLAVRALERLEACPGSILILSAAEEQFSSYFVSARPSLKKRIFICCHQPPSWYRLNWRNLGDFESLGGIICLGLEQASYFKSISASPVFAIRHGVRHDFFTPLTADSVRHGNRLIFVGQWLRDFDTLALAMELIWESRADTRLVCVVPRFSRNSPSILRLAVDSRVEWYSELTDTELRALYRSADLLFLPVIDSVANNAILEALSAALPVVTTDVAGMREYIPEVARSLCSRGDVSAHAEAVLCWLNNPSRSKLGGASARAWVTEKCDWITIATRLCSFLAAANNKGD